MKKKYIILIITMCLISILIVGGSYAYFSATINGNTNAENVVTNTGTLSLSFSDKTGKIDINNMQPGTWWEKRVIVKNTGTIPANFDLLFLKLNNQIENGELRISIYCTKGIEVENNNYKQLNDKKYFCNNFSSTYVLSEKSIPKQEGENITLVNNININPQDTYTFYINFLFKETNENQDYNQNKTFAANVGIKESQTYNINYFNEIIDGNVTITNNEDKYIYKVFELYNPIKPNTKYRLSCEIEANNPVYNDYGQPYSRYGCGLHTKNVDNTDGWYGNTMKWLSKNQTNKSFSKQKISSEFITSDKEIAVSWPNIEIIVDGSNENVKVGNIILEELN